MIYLTLFTVINNTFKKLLKISKQINLAFMSKKKKNCEILSWNDMPNENETYTFNLAMFYRMKITSIDSLLSNI